MSARPFPGNVPSPPDRFFGRREELDRVAALVGQGDRLVTIHGLAGMGKSRLAVEAAGRLVGELTGGVWWADLSTATTGEAVGNTIAAVFGIRLDGPDPVGRIGRGLAARGPLLIVLDDLDRLEPADAAAVARLVEAAPEARFLCTSRVPLKLRGERKIALGPLATDDGVGLLLDRSPGTVPPEHTPDVARLVEDLDGMPLAIEIAAARTRVMPVPELRRRLDDRLRLLVSDEADRPARHRSLAAAIEASAALLSEAGVAAARQLTAFQGGFTLGAADAVLALPGAPFVADVVQELVDASLLRLDPSGRLVMPSAVRAWAGTADPEARERHGRFYAELGSARSLAALDVHGGVERWHTIASELANLDVALEDALARADPAIAEGAALAIAAVLRRRGPAGAALQRLEVAGGHPTASVRVRIALAVTMREAGRWEEGVAVLGAVLAELPPGSEALEGEALLQLGSTWLQVGRWEQAEDCYGRAVGRFRASGERRLEGLVLAGLGLVHAEHGSAEQARAEYRESLVIARRIGDRVCEGTVLSNLGLLDRKEGRLAEARAGLEAALGVHRELGHRRAEGRTLCMIGAIAGDIGDPTLGREVVAEGLRAQREVGDRWFEALTIALLAQFEMTDGRWTAARDRLEEARAIHREVGNHRSEGATVGNLGTVLHALGDPEAGRRAWEQALEAARIHADREQVGAWLTCLARVEARPAPKTARARLEEAERLLRAGGSRIELGLALCVRAEIESAAGDTGSARIALDEAEQLAAQIGVGPRSLLASELERVRREMGDRSPAPGRALEVAPDGSGFRLGEAAAEVRTRHAIRRVLVALVEARRTVPGAPLDVDRLFAAGWPGERAVREAARERVYHAIGTLRRLGLGEVLERIEGGWRLDPGVALLP